MSVILPVMFRLASGAARMAADETISRIAERAVGTLSAAAEPKQ